MRSLMIRLHRDERGAVSLETVLILGAIALPLLVWLLKFGWPRVRNVFDGGSQKLQQETEAVTGTGSSE